MSARAAMPVAARLAASVRADEIGVALFPDRLLIVRVGGVWRRRVRHREVVELAPVAAGAPDWQAVVQALAGKVMEGALAGANVTLVLSSHFAHYVLVPGSALLRAESEQRAFVRERLRSVLGDAAEGWALQLSKSGPAGARLACAVPQTPVDALTEVMAPLGRRYRSLQPHLMASFNRWRARLGARPCWFVAAEPGLACLALLDAGEWQSVRTVKIGPDWPQSLADLLARERYLTDAAGECSEVRVFAPGLPAAVAPHVGGWRIENLQPALPSGLAGGADAAFAIAVGA